MCNPDLTAYNLFWEHPEAMDASAHANAPQSCADWNLLSEWFDSRPIPRAELAEMSGLSWPTG